MDTGQHGAEAALQTDEGIAGGEGVAAGVQVHLLLDLVQRGHAVFHVVLALEAQTTGVAGDAEVLLVVGGGTVVVAGVHGHVNLAVHFQLLAQDLIGIRTCGNGQHTSHGQANQLLIHQFLRSSKQKKSRTFAGRDP